MKENKLFQIFEETVDSDERYEGTLYDIDHYSLICKAAAKDRLFKFKEANVCMFNFENEGMDNVFMLFSMPINAKDGVKNIAERVISMVDDIEKSFITLDHISSRELKEEKFIYIVCIKKVE